MNKQISSFAAGVLFTMLSIFIFTIAINHISAQTANKWTSFKTDNSGFKFYKPVWLLQTFSAGKSTITELETTYKLSAFGGQNNDAITGTSNTNKGVVGKSSQDIAIYGESMSNIGIYGKAKNTAGVFGKSDNNIGVYGVGAYGIGGYGSEADFYGSGSGRLLLSPKEATTYPYPAASNATQYGGWSYQGKCSDFGYGSSEGQFFFVKNSTTKQTRPCFCANRLTDAQGYPGTELFCF